MFLKFNRLMMFLIILFLILFLEHIAAYLKRIIIKSFRGTVNHLLKPIYEKHNNCKDELNRRLDNIFDTRNSYYEITTKNFRKNWFMPLVNSLSYTIKYKRENRSYKTSYNNWFIEGMNNKIKLIKRNAHGFRYFDNLRKRILMHLGYSYEFTYKKGLTISR